MKIKKKFKLSLKNRQAISGYCFALPFIIGFIFFVLVPFYQAVIFSLNELTVGGGGFELDFLGFTNYHYALLVDPNFLEVFFNAIRDMALELPLIIAFSFFSAMILKQEFKGRTPARLIFFLPVIMGAGIILQIEEGDFMMERMQSGREAFAFSGAALRNMLYQTRLPEGILEGILYAVERIPSIIRASGIQILIFLAGLQSIPRSIYEAAEVEGATAWENFWLITFPLLSPLIITNIVYTIVDSFTTPVNEIVMLIRDTAFTGAGFGVSMAMAILYFITIIIILGIVIKILSRWAFYQE